MNTGNKPRRPCRMCARTVAHGATTGHALPHNCPHQKPCAGGQSGSREPRDPCDKCHGRTVVVVVDGDNGERAAAIRLRADDPTAWVREHAIVSREDLRRVRDLAERLGFREDLRALGVKVFTLTDEPIAGAWTDD